jgi:Subtilase family/Secretion system C-terminal sorting domain
MKTKYIFITFLSVLIQTFLNAQCAMNQEWVSSVASPDTLEITSTTLDNFGHILMTGNTKTSNQGVNCLTIKYDLDGNILWQTQFNGTGNATDYGSAVVADASGNVYVTGTTYNSAAQGYNYLLLKLNPSGQIVWSVQYNGTGSGYDVASAICLDNNGDIIVTGSSQGTGSPLNLDYLTIKYNSSGNLVWSSRYNYNGLFDLATALVVDNSNNVFVTGSSATSINNADITTVKYSSTGTQSGIHRLAVQGSSIDKATAISKDNSGNIIICGSTFQAIGKTDLRAIKYSNNLSILWNKTFDAEGLNDCANSLDVNSAGEVFVGGYSQKQNGGKDYLTIKYSVSGNEDWNRRQSAAITTDLGEIHKIKTSGTGVVVTGEMTNAGAKSILTILYDSTGLKTWEHVYDSPQSSYDKAYSLNVTGNNIIVSGKQQVGLTEKYVTVKYSTIKVNYNLDLTAGYSHAKNQVIVRFDPSVLNMTNIDNKEKGYGIVSDFVNTAGLIKMNQSLGVDASKWTAIKVYPWLNSQDSISTSRLGEDVQVPDFWATLLILTESGEDSTVRNNLNAAQPEICRAELNLVYSLFSLPNDPSLATQFSLYSSQNFPNAGINLYPAWNNETGQSFVKVGVFDGGIDQTHPDLVSSVAGGYDFFNNTSLTSPYDNTGHGTSCAGIIGAKSNNGIGIAGIAGGDNSTNYQGVELYDMRISDASFAVTTVIANAITQGATSANLGGFELWVMSNSWGNPAYSMELHDAVQYSNKNGVIFCAARGNFDGITPNIDDNIFPSCFVDEMVLSVGGAGTDGEWKTVGNGNQNDPVDNNGEAMYGNAMDFIAPFSNAIVYTTDNTGGYHGFNGTSASTPHVAGLSSLMLSYYDLNYPNPQNLAIEDVEHLIEMSCIDKGITGYDDKSGWGLINADGAINTLYKPYHHVRHFGQANTNLIVPTYLGDFAVTFAVPYGNLGVGTYIAEVYEVTHTLNYSLGANEQIVSVWPRYSSSIGWSPNGANGFNDNYCTVASYSSTQAIVKTYSFHIISDISGTILYNYNYPAPGYQTKVALSIYTYDPTAVGQTENTVITNDLSVFPNPTADNLTVKFNLNTNSDVLIRIFDNNGRLVKQENSLDMQAGEFSKSISVSDLANGIYFMEIETSEESFRKKISVCHQ